MNPHREGSNTGGRRAEGARQKHSNGPWRPLIVCTLKRRRSALLMRLIKATLAKIPLANTLFDDRGSHLDVLPGSLMKKTRRPRRPRRPRRSICLMHGAYSLHQGKAASAKFVSKDRIAVVKVVSVPIKRGSKMILS